MDFGEYDLQGQQEDLQRRKAIVDALTARTLQPTTGDLIRGLFGSSIQDRASAAQQQYQQDAAAYRQREQQQLGSELDAFSQRMSGAPARAPVSLGNNEETGQPAPAYGPTLPAQAPNPREAVVRAMTSQLPEMQAMGKAAMASLMKPTEYKFHQAGDTLFKEDPRTGEVTVAGSAPKAQWVDEDKTIDGKTIPGQRDKMTGQWVPKVPAGTTVNVDTKGQTEVQKAAIEALKTSRDQANMGIQNVEAAQRVLQALDDPQVRTGFGASVANGLASVGAKFGFNEGESVAKTQALASDLAKNTLAAGQNMKGSFSDKDIVFLNQVAGGSIDLNPQALQYLAHLAYAQGHNLLMSANEQWLGSSKVRGIEDAAGVFPFPKVTYDARIGDRPGFSMNGSGRLTYVPPAASAAPNSGRQRQRISVQDFLAPQ